MKISNSKERIKELLADSGDSVSEMGRKTNISKSTISRYMNGIRIPNQENISKIATAYRVSPAWLMGYDVDMNGKITNEIISLYESLNEKDKDFVIDIMKYLAERG